jgi:hypothetical protein
MAFEYGESGNPKGGSVPAATVAVLRKRASALARQGTEKNIELLEEIRDNVEAGLALRANVAFGLLDRGWGRPPQAVSLHLEDDHDANADAGLAVLPLLNSISESIARTAGAGDGEGTGPQGSVLSVEILAPQRGRGGDTVKG